MYSIVAQFPRPRFFGPTGSRSPTSAGIRVWNRTQSDAKQTTQFQRHTAGTQRSQTCNFMEA